MKKDADNPQWQRSRSEAGPDLGLFRTRFDWMHNPRNGHEQRMVVLESPDAVQVVARHRDGLLLVQQYRFGIGEELWELPGGLVDEGESILEAAQRELLEETGYRAQHWHYLGSQAANPVFMSARIHHYLAEDLDAEPQLQQLDASEAVQVHQWPQAEVEAYLAKGGFQHPHTVCGLVAFLMKKK